MKGKEVKSTDSVTVPLAWSGGGAKEGSGGKLVVEKKLKKRGKPRFKKSEMRGGLPSNFFNKSLNKWYGGKCISAEEGRYKSTQKN